MAAVVKLREREIAEAEARLARLRPSVQRFAHILAGFDPPYRYDKSGFPRLYPPPAPGLPSAVAAAEALTMEVWGKLR